MTSKPHLAFGLFAGAVVTSCFQMSDSAFTSKLVNVLAAFIATLIGALASDLDAPHSPLSRLLPFISKPIQRRWPHRTACHSLIGVFVFSAVVYYTADFLVLFLPIPERIPFILCLFFLGAVIGHLIVDSLTVNGICWLWPYKRAFAYPSSPQYRIRTGDKAERYYTLFFLFLFFLYLPVLKAGGASRAIHRTFKNIAMAKDDYMKAANIETWLTFKASYRHDRASVSGRSLILDAKEDCFIIYFDGRILTIGEQALLLGTEFICEYTSTAPQLAELSVVNEPMDSILARIPNNVLMSGELAANKEFQATSPVYTSNDFPTVKLVSGRIEFEYANKKEALSLNVRIPEDVRRLQNDVRKLEKDIELAGIEVDSLAEERSRKKELLVRYSLQKRIEEMKSEKKAMEKSMETKKRQLDDYGSPVIEFSGKLSMRKLPPAIQER